MKKEQWKDIEGYEGMYQVSTLGRVRNSRTNHVLKQTIQVGGYRRVNLWKEGKSTGKLVHRLVALAFIPNPENKPFVDHILQVSAGGGDELENLRWATVKENNNNQNQKTPKRTTDKLKQIDIKTGEVVATYPSVRAAERATGISKTGISLCLNGKRKQASGYQWGWM